MFGQPAGNAAKSQFGQPAAASGGFAFGQASQFGGLSSGLGMGMGMGMGSGGFGAGTGAPAVASDDPYANIDIDFSKVKSAPLPGKPFERKSEEEKQAEKKVQEASGVRSSLKTTKEDFENAAKNKKEVKFGKSITYQIEQVDS
jgi:hypothetical protein